MLDGTAERARRRASPRGAYTLVDEAATPLDLVLIGTGSEVAVAVAARRDARRARARRCGSCRCRRGSCSRSRPTSTATRCCRPSCPTLAVEAGVRFGWERYADDVVSIDRFGASAPGDVVMRELGITPEHVVERALALLGVQPLGGGTSWRAPIKRLIEFGQSPWYDNLTRALATGGLRDARRRARHPRRHVEPDDLREGDGVGQRLRRAAARGHRGAARRHATRTGISSRPTSRTPPTSCARTTTSGTAPTASCRSRCRPTSRTTPTARSRRRRSSGTRLDRPERDDQDPGDRGRHPRDRGDARRRASTSTSR